MPGLSVNDASEYWVWIIVRNWIDSGFLGESSTKTVTNRKFCNLENVEEMD
jgi:hypothetical protein